MVSCIMCGHSQNARKIGITFHRFPKDPRLRAAWLEFANRSEESIPKSAAICSEHFEESNFDRTGFYVTLIPNSVPSIHIVRHKYDKICNTQTELIIVEVNATKEQTESIEPDSDPLDITNELEHSLERMSKTTSICDDVRNGKLQPQIEKISNINVKQFEQIRDITNESKCPLEKTSHLMSISVADDTVSKVKLLQQIEKISSRNIKQSEQIRILQKKTWFQKKRISKLNYQILELQKSHLISDNINKGKKRRRSV